MLADSNQDALNTLTSAQLSSQQQQQADPSPAPSPHDGFKDDTDPSELALSVAPTAYNAYYTTEHEQGQSSPLFTFTRCADLFTLYYPQTLVQPHCHFKGEVHPKINASYLVVFGVLSQMVKVRCACDKLF